MKIVLILISCLLLIGCSKETSIELWGKINIAEWDKTPCIQNRTAIEKDVKTGFAVFYIDNSDDLKTIKMNLPCCAILIDKESNERTPVIIIQAEESQKQRLIGYRSLNGGNGIGLESDFIFLDKPNEEFR